MAFFLYPDRIVLGSNCCHTADLLTKTYKPLLSRSCATSSSAIPVPDNAHIPARLVITGSASAELIKHAANAFLAMKISFANAIADICEANGADVEDVLEGIGSDSASEAST